MISETKKISEDCLSETQKKNIQKVIDPNSGPMHQDGSAAPDLACFALWNKALEKQDEILASLHENYSVIGDFLVYWTDKNYNRNIARFYERNTPSEDFKGYHSKIGPPPFRFIIVKDPTPHYKLMRSVSGVIEPTNTKTSRLKDYFRSLFTTPYQVHASNNIEEFFFQSAITLGPEILSNILASAPRNEDAIPEKLYKDLEGAQGWESWNDLLSTLNFSTTYLVLRNFDALPHSINDNDIDILTNNMQRLASAANIYQNEDRPFKGHLMVSEKKFQSDIRFPGDGYYCTKWSYSMLTNRQYQNGVWTPNKEDLLFSLIYHGKVHKNKLKNVYKEQIEKLANEIELDWIDPEKLDDDDYAANILSGYFKGKNYFYIDPIDQGVGRNKRITKQLPSALTLKTRRTRKIIKLAFKAAKNPHRILPWIINKITRKENAPPQEKLTS